MRFDIPPTQPADGSTLGVIIVIAVVAVLLIGAVVWYLRRRSR